MPYRVVQKDSQHCVVKVRDGKVMGCHENRSKALRQIAALEASESEKAGSTYSKPMT